MKKLQIAKTLKYYRKINELSVPRVSEMLKEYDITAAPKTIYGWECGQTQPSANTLLVLCSIYQIEDVLCAFGYRERKEDVAVLTEEEEKIITAYRSYTEMQPAVKKLLSP